MTVFLRLPKLVRFVIVNTAIGVMIGWALAGLFLYMNVGGIGALLMRSEHKIVILSLLGMSSGVTFGFAYLATAVMTMPYDKDGFDRM